MPDVPITVAIPVGPAPEHVRWLDACLESVKAQTYPAAEILLIDDMAGLIEYDPDVRIWRSPWHLGLPSAFNFGVALASTELVFMMGSDDLMYPNCLEQCAQAYALKREEIGERANLEYYYVGINFIPDDGTCLCPQRTLTGDHQHPAQFAPNNTAMVSKALWKATGGFAVESVVGLCDWGFLQVIGTLGYKAYGVGDGSPLVGYRWHPDCETAKRASWYNIANQVAYKLTEEAKPPAWGRYE